MPIYEYQCQKCQTLFEEWQSGFEELEMECPQCGEQSKRLISQSSFHLKGSGWYADGYSGKKPESSPGKGGAEAKGKKAKDDSGGGISAPAPKKKSSDVSSTDFAS
jgi:putative FmdB family regulatory protein